MEIDLRAGLNTCNQFEPPHWCDVIGRLESDKTKWMLLEYQPLKSLTMFKEDWFEGWAQYLHSDSTYSINIHTLMKYLEKLESFFLLDREIGKW